MRFIALAFSICACFRAGPQDAARVIHQVSHGENSPNISNVSGSATITYNCTFERYRSFATDYTWPSFATSSIPLLRGGADSIVMWDGLPKIPGGSGISIFSADGQVHFPGALPGSATDSIAGLDGLLKPIGASNAITFSADGQVRFPAILLGTTTDSITGLDGLLKIPGASSLIPFGGDG